MCTEVKSCFKCGEDKPLSDYYKHSGMSDGHLGKCKECAKEDVKLNRVMRREQYAEYERNRFQDPKRKASVVEAARRHNLRYPEKYLARTAVRNAVRSGRLARENCEMCGCETVEAHHDDYSKPLDVRWLCFKHHRELHGQVVAA